MLIAAIAGVCVILLVLGFLLPRLSRYPQRGVDEGLGARLAMEGALAAAALAPAAVGYVNLHGTATRTNDVAEGRAVRDVFGSRTPCGAAGITEAIVALLALERGFLPGTANTRARDIECGCNVLLDGEVAAPRYVLSNSFGFGGNNCSVIFGRPS